MDGWVDGWIHSTDLVGRRGDGQHREALHGVDGVNDRVLAAARVLAASLQGIIQLNSFHKRKHKKQRRGAVDHQQWQCSSRKYGQKRMITRIQTAEVSDKHLSTYSSVDKPTSAD